MNSKLLVIYFAGLIQGITLVAFPAVSTILTNPEAYHFSNTEYGSLFIPQALLSIVAAAANPTLCRYFTAKSVFLTGLIANLISMLLLLLSVFVMYTHFAAYGMLLIATGFLGIGFGLLVPTLNSMTALLHPDKIDTYILVLNAILGIGTALAPIFISIFVSFGFWWGLPLLLILSSTVLLAFSLPQHLPGGKFDFVIKHASEWKIPARFWLFGFFALLYGIIETLNGTWLSIYMKDLHAIAKLQSFALAAFWGMVTLGRIFFAFLSNWISATQAFLLAPFICAIAFLLIATLHPGESHGAILAFGLAGFGCSVLLPLVISFGSQQLKTISESVPGMIISFYLLGYGIAAFGVGPLEEFAQIHLRIAYAVGLGISVLLGILSYLIIKNTDEETVHGKTRFKG